jgi:hypothetical protein
MPEFYQTHLRHCLSVSQFLLLRLVIQLLQTLKTVKLESLATHLPLPIQTESRRRKLKRFLSLPLWSFERLWHPILLEQIQRLYAPGVTLFVALDRTQWKDINLLVVSWVDQGRAIPVYWMPLSHLGNSNFKEQKSLLLKACRLFKEHKMVVLGDREFCSVKLAKWLNRQGVGFCLRLRCHEYFQHAQGEWQQFKQLGLKPGMKAFFRGVKVTKTHQVQGFHVAAYWRRSHRKKRAKEGWFLLTNLPSLTAATQAYKKRMGIEQLFRDCKRGGYDLEGTGLQGSRLKALLLILTLAYGIATFMGQKLRQRRVAHYIARPSHSRQKYSRHSHFYTGLYADAWVNFADSCQELVHALLQLTPGKRPFYQRGQAAMSLIRSTL